MKSKKNVVSLEKILPHYEVTFPFPLDFSLNRQTWHANAGQKMQLSYEQYEVLNHSEYGEELFKHND